MDVVSLKFRFNTQCDIPTFNYSSRMFTIERVKNTMVILLQPRKRLDNLVRSNGDP